VQDTVYAIKAHYHELFKSRGYLWHISFHRALSIYRFAKRMELEPIVMMDKLWAWFTPEYCRKWMHVPDCTVPAAGWFSGQVAEDWLKAGFPYDSRKEPRKTCI
jgi:hypothetical protein